jgi:hypothetical protein
VADWGARARALPSAVLREDRMERETVVPAIGRLRDRFSRWHLGTDISQSSHGRKERRQVCSTDAPSTGTGYD